MLERLISRPAGVRPQRDHNAEEPRGKRTLPLGGVAARRSRSSSPSRGTGRPSRSCSATRRSGRRSTRRSSRGTPGRRSRRAGSTKPFRPWHGLRHTALTETAAAGCRRCSCRRRLARARVDNGAVPSRLPDELPRHGGTRRGADVPIWVLGGRMGAERREPPSHG